MPEETIQDLRDLTRTRKHLVEAKNSEKNRLHKILQSAGIKITTYIEDIFGASGRNLIELLINGEVITEEKVKSLVYTSLKKKVPQIVEALNGFVRGHHRFLLEQSYQLILSYEKIIKNLTIQIDKTLAEYEEQLSILTEIPGVDRITASVVIAEIGIDMSQFPNVTNLASWAGICPGNNESSGKRKSTRINKGNPYLKKVLCQAAWAATRAKGSRFQVKFSRIKHNRGAQKATIAIAHDILKIIYILFSRCIHYIEYGENYHKKNVPVAS